MKIKTFNYVRHDGKESKRVLAIYHEPCEHFEGLDISELNELDQAAVISELNKAYDEYTNKLVAICDEYDVNNRYRRFLPHRMSNVKDEHI